MTAEDRYFIQKMIEKYDEKIHEYEETIVRLKDRKQYLTSKYGTPAESETNHKIICN